MNRRIETIHSDDLEALAGYSWPGNIRELQNFVERAVILSRGAVLRLPAPAEPKWIPRSAPSEARTLAEAEREHILRALQETDWVVGGAGGAALRLGLRRTTLIYKMRRLGISRSAD
jgi:formate hydrogenlyase transcriptional activator